MTRSRPAIASGFVDRRNATARTESNSVCLSRRAKLVGTRRLHGLQKLQNLTLKRRDASLVRTVIDPTHSASREPMKNFLTPSLRPLLPALLLAGLGLRSAAAPAPVFATDPRNISPASESVGPLILRDESIDQVLALLEKWTGKTILRPQALPNATITLSLTKA